MCSLIHKFGSSDNDELSDEGVDTFLDEIQNNMMSNFEVKDDIYVFVDECHTASNQGNFIKL